MKTATVSSILLALLPNVYSEPMPLRRRAASNGVPMKSVSNAAASGSGALINVGDVDNNLYLVDIVLGGKNFTVQMDTGSTDLWVFPNGTDISLTNTTSAYVFLPYGIGNCSGYVDFAEVKFGPYTIPSQAFVNVNETHDDEALFSQGAQGILGLSFSTDTASVITKAFDLEYGNGTGLDNSVTTNIFAQSPDAPKSFDIQLARVGDAEDTAAGTLLIGEHLEGYESVVDQPKLYKASGTSRWTIPLDEMVVNDVPFTFAPSSVEGIPTGKAGATLDTGYTLAGLPAAAVDAIYGAIPGAVNVSASGLEFQWLVPCTAVIPVSFSFGGIQYSVHPLDLTFVDFINIDVENTSTKGNFTICVNSFQYLELPPNFVGFDLVLGDVFLRNIYASFSIGDAAGNNNIDYVQLLPTNNITEAIPDFVNVRAAALASLPVALEPLTIAQLIPDIVTGGNSSSDTPAATASAAATAATTPASKAIAAGALEDNTGSNSSSGSNDHLTSLFEKYGPIALGLLAANVVFGLVLCIVALIACLRRNGAKTRKVSPSYAPVRFKDAESTLNESYRD